MTDSSVASGSLDEIEQPTFDVLPLSKEVRRAVDELGYVHPTPVQRAVFESTAKGSDIVVQARTGTGKTAAFGLPVVDRLVNVSEAKAQILVLSPTRELALQISREMENLAKHKGVTCTAIYGGASMQPQVDAIRAGAQIIVGTPGRVLDHLERGTLNPKTIKTLVLDESDEMLSMGFFPQITRVMEQLPEKHQTLLFSATLPPDVKRIAETRLRDPEFITLSGDHIGALSIDHFIYRSTGNKADELVQVLEIENPDSAIIFCNTRDQTKRLAGALNKNGFAADWLNADLAQNDREKVMRATREGRLRFLVCTDVAARGIDISHLTHVINADFPESTEAYVHRTGRTGRAGNTGTAISLVTPQDVGNLYMLRLTYKIFPLERDLPSASDLATRKEADLVEFLHAAFMARPLAGGDRSLARRVLTSDVAETIVAGLLRDHLGGHPGAENHAGEARRAQMPAPVPTVQSEQLVQPEQREKKGDKKKKKDKDKSHKKEKVRFDDEKPREKRSKSEFPAHAESSHAVLDKVDSEHARAVARPSRADRVERRPERERTQPKLENGTALLTKERPLAVDGSNGTDRMEVISASSLLDASERAFLEHDSTLGGPRKTRNVRAEQGSQPKSFARSRDERPGDDRKHQGKAESVDARPAAHQDSPSHQGPPADKVDHDDENLGRIFVDAGKRDQVYRDDFLDALEDNGFDPNNVVFVNVRDTHSFIGVDPAALDLALAALDGRTVAGLQITAEKARPRRAKP